MVPFDSLSKTALEINLFDIARLDSIMLPYMVTLVTIYGNRCMGGRERSSEDHVIGVVFDEESHGNIRFHSFGRRYTVLKQSGRSKRRGPLNKSRVGMIDAMNKLKPRVKGLFRPGILG